MEEDMRKKTVFKVLLVVAMIAILLGGCARKERAAMEDDVLQPGTYTWIAGGLGGGWYSFAGGFARLVNQLEPMITITVVPGGGVGNPVALDQGDADFAWGVGYVTKMAYEGTAPIFSRRHTNIRSIAGTLAVDYYHLLAARDQNISSMQEFAQRVKDGGRFRVAAPVTGTSDALMVQLVLEYYGISFDAIRANGGSVTQAVYADIPNLFKDRHVDFAFACIGIPGAIMTEMTMSRPSVLLEVCEDLIDYMYNTYGTVSRGSGLTWIPGGSYQGIPDAVRALCHSTEILVHPSMPDIVVYTFAKILNENKDFLVQMQPAYRTFDPLTTGQTVTVPLHPGAERFYREKGLLP